MNKLAIVYIDNVARATYDVEKKYNGLALNVLLKDDQKHIIQCHVSDFCPCGFTTDVLPIDEERIDEFHNALFNVLYKAVIAAYHDIISMIDIQLMKNDDGFVVCKVRINSKLFKYFSLVENGEFIDNGLNRQIKERMNIYEPESATS
jgi:hypothetical protein